MEDIKKSRFHKIFSRVSIIRAYNVQKLFELLGLFFRKFIKVLYFYIISLADVRSIAPITRFISILHTYLHPYIIGY